MKLAYIAGPYRAPTASGIVANIRAAEAVAIRAMALGYAPITPHMNTALWDGLFPDETFLLAGLAMIDRCDVLVLVPGWIDSAGTLMEIKRARVRGIPVYEAHELPEAIP
jgi:hypothetical protein